MRKYFGFLIFNGFFEFQIIIFYSFQRRYFD